MFQYARPLRHATSLPRTAASAPGMAFCYSVPTSRVNYVRLLRHATSLPRAAASAGILLFDVHLTSMENNHITFAHPASTSASNPQAPSALPTMGTAIYHPTSACGPLPAISDRRALEEMRPRRSGTVVPLNSPCPMLLFCAFVTLTIAPTRGHPNRTASPSNTDTETARSRAGIMNQEPRDIGVQFCARPKCNMLTITPGINSAIHFGISALISVVKVRFGSGSGPFSANAEPELPVGSGNPPNPEPERQVQMSSKSSKPKPCSVSSAISASMRLAAISPALISPFRLLRSFVPVKVPLEKARSIRILCASQSRLCHSEERIDRWVGFGKNRPHMYGKRCLRPHILWPNVDFFHTGKGSLTSHSSPKEQ
ncbi:hypothetical protein C8R44DRAFT_754542 [Mycena epipterygia]|nr:hypothetical protein C8R44DRAFT_754542 [Mycena epipterygia]